MFSFFLPICLADRKLFVTFAPSYKQLFYEQASDKYNPQLLQVKAGADSFARGEERPDSDIDILIQFTPDAKMGFAFFGMICDLEEKLARNVDLVVEGSLLPFARESANKDKILVYERAN